MVAASKMRKAQERMRQFRPYGDKIRNIVAHLALAISAARHFCRSVSRSRRSGSSGDDRKSMRRPEHQHTAPGAGGSRELDAQGVKAERPRSAIRAWASCRGSTPASCRNVQIGDRPHLEKMIGPVKALVDMYADGRIDAVYVAYSRFVKRETGARDRQLLPLSTNCSDRGRETRVSWDVTSPMRRPSSMHC